MLGPLLFCPLKPVSEDALSLRLGHAKMRDYMMPVSRDALSLAYKLVPH